MRNRNKYKKGIAIIISVLVVAVLMSIIFALSAIFIPKIKVASDTKNSVTAVYAAESAVEWCLYKNRIGDAPEPVMANGSTYKLTLCTPGNIKAIGEYRNVTRAFEITQP